MDNQQQNTLIFWYDPHDSSVIYLRLEKRPDGKPDVMMGISGNADDEAWRNSVVIAARIALLQLEREGEEITPQTWLPRLLAAQKEREGDPYYQ